MKIIVTKDYQAMSRCAADLVQACVEKEPQSLVSFPGGDTPIGMLEEFVSRVNQGVIDPTGLKFVQLDDCGWASALRTRAAAPTSSAPACWPP